MTITTFKKGMGRFYFWASVVLFFVGILIPTTKSLADAPPTPSVEVLSHGVYKYSVNANGSVVTIYQYHKKTFGLLFRAPDPKHAAAQVQVLQKQFEKLFGLESERHIDVLDVVSLMHSDSGALTELFYIKTLAPPGFDDKILYGDYQRLTGE